MEAPAPMENLQHVECLQRFRCAALQPPPPDRTAHHLHAALQFSKDEAEVWPASLVRQDAGQDLKTELSSASFCILALTSRKSRPKWDASIETTEQSVIGALTEIGLASPVSSGNSPK